MEKFRWAYIGSGNIAKNTAREITKGNHSIVSVYSRNFAKAKAFASKYKARAFSDFESAVNRDDVDGVYIATPHTSHVEYAVAAMKLGKPVLCEKPVGVSHKDADTLIQTARATDTYFCEAMWTWFSEVALTVKKWVQSGEIGEIKSVEITHAFPGVLMSKNSRVLKPETAGGALLDVGVYPITYCYNLFGTPEKIICNGEVKNGIDMRETVTLEYNGFKCTLNMSLYTLKESCTIIGSNGKISLPILFHMAPLAILKNQNGRKVFTGKTNYLNEFTLVSQEIMQGKKQSDYIPFDTTSGCMQIMDECRRQMKLIYPFENIEIS